MMFVAPAAIAAGCIDEGDAVANVVAVAKVTVLEAILAVILMAVGDVGVGDGGSDI